MKSDQNKPNGNKRAEAIAVLDRILRRRRKAATGNDANNVDGQERRALERFEQEIVSKTKSISARPNEAGALDQGRRAARRPTKTVASIKEPSKKSNGDLTALQHQILAKAERHHMPANGPTSRYTEDLAGSTLDCSTVSTTSYQVPLNDLPDCKGGRSLLERQLMEKASTDDPTTSVHERHQMPTNDLRCNEDSTISYELPLNDLPECKEGPPLLERQILEKASTNAPCTSDLDQGRRDDDLGRGDNVESLDVPYELQQLSDMIETSSAAAERSDMEAQTIAMSEAGTDIETPVSHVMQSEEGAIVATVVDEEYVREHSLSYAAIATAVKINPRRRALIISTVLCLGLMILMSIVCGTGNCTHQSNTATTDDSMRANAIVQLINSRTLRSTGPIELSLVYNETASPPEEMALQYVIDQLSDDYFSENGEWRVLQRYALAVLWFANSPFTIIPWLSDINECGWTGVLCSETDHVIAIDLIKSGAKGYIPDDIGLLTALEWVKYGGNSLTGVIPSSFQHLQHLEGLSLWGNEITGTIPKFLGNMTKLSAVSFWKNKLTGTVPDELFEGNLENLGIGDNRLTGQLPTNMGLMTTLTTLGIFSNDFTGEVPQGIFELTALEHLSISDTHFKGPFPSLSMFVNLPRIISLTVGSNVGSIDLQVETGCPWPNIEKLIIAKLGPINRGPIPPVLAHCTKLKKLALRENSLFGTIPSTVFDNWTSMEVLQLDSNSLSGTLPASIGRMKSLEQLKLFGNALSGTLPLSLGNLTNLETFHVHDNLFSGTMPTEAVHWVGRDIKIRGNNFTGYMPFCQNSTEVFDKLNVECDKVICECCRVCFNQ